MGKVERASEDREAKSKRDADAVVMARVWDKVEKNRRLRLPG